MGPVGLQPENLEILRVRAEKPQLRLEQSVHLQKELQLLKISLFKGRWWIRFDVPLHKRFHSFCEAQKYWAALCLSLWTLLTCKKIAKTELRKCWLWKAKYFLRGATMQICCLDIHRSCNAVL